MEMKQNRTPNKYYLVSFLELGTVKIVLQLGHCNFCPIYLGINDMYFLYQLINES